MPYLKSAVLLVSFASAMPWLSLTQETIAPVPLTSEHHHHLVYASAKVRAFDVEIQPGDTTLVHQHDADYIWVGLGQANVVNIPVGKPEVHLASKDAALHFAPGPFAHKAHNEGETVYRNVTIELLEKQTRPRNLCEQVLSDEPVHCVASTAEFFTERKGLSLQPEFETDQMRFDILQIEPGEELKIAALKNPPLLIALDKTQAHAMIEGQADQTLTDGNVLALRSGSPLDIHNTGKAAARFLVFEFKEI